MREIASAFLAQSHAAIEAEMAQTQALERTLKVLLEDLPLKQAVEIAVKLTGQKKNLVYEIALGLKQANSPIEPP